MGLSGTGERGSFGGLKIGTGRALRGETLGDSSAPTGIGGSNIGVGASAVCETPKGPSDTDWLDFLFVGCGTIYGVNNKAIRGARF